MYFFAIHSRESQGKFLVIHLGLGTSSFFHLTTKTIVFPLGILFVIVVLSPFLSRRIFVQAQYFLSLRDDSIFDLQ